MIDPRKLLDQFLGSQVPGVDGTVKDRASSSPDVSAWHSYAADTVELTWHGAHPESENALKISFTMIRATRPRCYRLSERRF
jgi:hypothetical protein